MPREQGKFGTGVRIVEPNTDASRHREPSTIGRIRNITRYLTFTEARVGTLGQTPSGIVLGNATLQKRDEDRQENEIEKLSFFHLSNLRPRVRYIPFFTLSLLFAYFLSIAS
jgi:hypothetical protein